MDRVEFNERGNSITMVLLSRVDGVVESRETGS
jgi:hypothetical protein